MQFTCGLLYSTSCRCLIVSLLLALCLLLFVFLINCFMFLIYSFSCFFYVRFASCFGRSVFIVLFLPMYIVVYFLFVYNFYVHCHLVAIQWQLRNKSFRNMRGIF